MDAKMETEKTSTTVHEVSIEPWSDVEAFCTQNEYELSQFFAAVWSITFHRYFEKDILYLSMNGPLERQSSALKGDNQVSFWSVAMNPEMGTRDLFENGKAITRILEYTETERETASGIWLTTKENFCGDSSSLETKEMAQNYEFQLVISISYCAPVVKLCHSSSPQREYQGQHIASTVGRVAQSLVANIGGRIKDISLFSQNDLAAVSKWNQRIGIPSEHKSIADVIQDEALSHPNAVAIHAWDGRLTYHQLDTVTERIAVHLRQNGVGPEVQVPVCFEKSMWAIIAELAVLRAGGAFVPMDPAQPQHRLRHIVEQTKATVIVASELQSDHLSIYGPPIIALSPRMLDVLPSDGLDTSHCLGFVDANSAAYVLFTSGSTGNSKGCVVNQSALADISRHCEALRLSRQSRVLQFASYTFGVSLIEIFCALAAGATIHIPSEQDRLNNLVGYLRDKEINWAFLTPSTANAIDDPSLVPQLETIILAGEPMGQHHVEKWAGRVNLHQAYGLTEWAGICAVSPRIAGPETNVETVGLLSPVAKLWLTDPLDHSKLMPIGAVAELLIEGPSLARGYLNNATKTAETFINTPTWLDDFVPGAGGRVYKTGDLVQYQPDGSFRYIARKDTQVKIRGKRLELSEVEYCVSQNSPGVTRAIAEAVVPEDSDGMPILAVFLFYATLDNNGDEGDDKQNDSNELLARDKSSGYAQFRSDVKLLKAEVPNSLPEHMVPALYLPLRRLPLTITGKIDRRNLRETMRQFTRETLESYSSEKVDLVQPTTDIEITLHGLFAQVLGVERHTFGMDDSFLQLGGDSIKAMRMARMCREHGLWLTVKDVLELQTINKLLTCFESVQEPQPPPQNETLEKVNKALSSDSDDTSERWLSGSEATSPPSGLSPRGPFPRLPLGSEDLELLATKKLPTLNISLDGDVEDAFPCSFVQEGILLSQAKHPAYYEMRFIWEIESTVHGQSIEVGKLQRAWEKLIMLHPMLRTIFIEGVISDAFAVQVTLTEGNFDSVVIPCDATSPSEVPCPERLLHQRGRQSLPQLSLYPSTTGKVFALLDINHAVTDATSMSIMMRDLSRLYSAEDMPLSRKLQYSDYVSHLHNRSASSTREFWKSYLADVTPCLFPQLNLENPAESHSSWQAVSVELGDIARYHQFCANTGITLANVFKLAWSLVLRGFTASDKICFGYMTSGRDVPLAGIEDAVGPFINMLICYLEIHSEKSLLEILQGLQSEFIQTLPHQRVSLAEIRHSLGLAGEDALFNTTLTFPPQAEEEEVRLIKITEADRQDPGEYDIVVEVIVQGEDISVTMKHWTHALSEPQANGVANTLGRILSHIIEQPHKSARDIQMLSAVDEERIRQWNHILPQASEHCVHELISQQCLQQPHSEAVCAWDGTLTYREMEELSSTFALNLVESGVKPGDSVLLYMSRSYWTPVAMLAVMKAAGVIILLDPSYPLQRLREICCVLQQPRTVITSMEHRGLAEQLAPEVMIAEKARISIPLFSKASYNQLPSVVATDSLYVVFTSGSTGQPKGVLVDHQSYSTNSLAQIRSFKLSWDSRLLQFSGYTFDVSIFEHLTVLIAGGCLCIPSESDRFNELASTATQMRVNSMFLTPSVARMLSPGQVPTLNTLALVGEPMTQVDVDTWCSSVRLMNGYGPAEATVFCGVQPSVGSTDPQNIGWSTACVFWIANPDNPHQLLPVGAVGELLVEGPILAQCYLNDPETTATSFIEPPAWLRAFRGKAFDAKKCRLYRTGDLVQYTSNGSVRYIGRKDTQVKLRGQRFELADVEHHVRQHFQESREVIADVIRAGFSGASGVLVALVARSRFSNVSSSQGDHGHLLGSPDDVEFQAAVALAQPQLHSVLPNHMVPTVFLPLNEIPITKTGKADRRRLRQLVNGLSASEIDTFVRGQVIRRCPSTVTEHKLRELFAQTLSLNPNQVGADDHFFQLRGDSISAMNLVSEARRLNLYLTVADVFTYPKLSDLATVVRDATGQPSLVSVPPFSLLMDGDGCENKICTQAVRDCNFQSLDQVDDIYPSTALQEGLMALSSQKTGKYRGQFVFDLDHKVDISRLQTAWQVVVNSNPILRTRIIQIESEGFFQVVEKDHHISWTQGSSANDWLVDDLEHTMTLGQPLLRFALIQPSKDVPSSTMIVTMHHAIYDQWSLALLLRQVDAAYHGSELETQNFSPFIKHLSMQDPASAQNFWKTEFAGIEAPPFPTPSVSTVNEGAETRSSLECSVDVQMPDNSTITLSNIILLAWAVVVSAYTDSEDVIFGLTVNGRSAAIPGVDKMTGPTIATLPFRIRVPGDQTVDTALAAVQQQIIRMIPFEQTGLQNIRRMGPEPEAACNFQTQLGIQPAQDMDAATPLMNLRSSHDYTAFASYPLVLVCGLTPQNDAVHIHANFKPSIVPYQETDALVGQFSYVLQQLAKQPKQTIANIDLITPEDKKTLQSWNGVVPMPFMSTVHDLVLRHAEQWPHKPAIVTTDSHVTFKELDLLSHHLARRLIAHGVQPGSMVPLCFDKSTWPVISMVAVLRAGATCVNIDPALPAGRVQDMLQNISPSIALASLSRQEFLTEHAPGPLDVIVVPSETDHKLDEVHGCALPVVGPSTAAFIIFTSGSSGKPKGIVMEHGNLTTSIHHHSDAMQVNSTSRSLHFAGYAFDASIYEIFTTLCNGGCVCIPSEHERINDLAGFIQRQKVTWMAVTPSVVNLLRPEEIPSVRTIVLGGEAVTHEHVNVWADCGLTLINGYGPAEGTICAGGVIPATGWKIGTIGPIVGGVGWVTIPSDPNRLAPLGAVGELLIEGPVVTRGYLNYPEHVSTGFIQPPAWLSSFRFPTKPERLYRSGDLVQYTSEGWIRFAGRKDTQIKLRGQRIELGEVEHHLRSGFAGACQVVAEVVRRGEDGQSALLIAFILRENLCIDDDASTHAIFAIPGSNFQSQASEVRSRLLETLPSYMVPAVLVPISNMPMTKTGKIDRKRLRDDAALLSSNDFQRLEKGTQGLKKIPSTDLELQLQNIWSSVLQITPEDIGVDDNFFSIGGESISAMRVVAQCSSSGLPLIVADIFKCQTIAVLAAHVRTKYQGGNSDPPAPFSLVGTHDNVAALLELAQRVCEVDRDTVEDLYPCTALQEGLMALTAKTEGAYVTESKFHLPQDIALDRLEGALKATVAANPILRTRVIQVDAQRCYQVVLSEDSPWQLFSEIQSYNRESSRYFGLGKPLVQFGVVKQSPSVDRYDLALRIHHAIYDGWSFPMLLDQIQQAYEHLVLPSRLFNPFIAYIREQNAQAAEFWRSELASETIVTFPALPSPDYQPAPRSSTTRMVRVGEQKHDDVTLAVRLQLAWALVQSQYTGSHDVVFGITATGRAAAVPGIENMTGPTQATIPMRVTVDPKRTVMETLRQYQSKITNTTPYEQFGLQNIIQCGDTHAAACRFQALLVIQPPKRDRPQNLFVEEERLSDLYAFNPYALMLICQLHGEAVEIQAIFDCQVVPVTHMDQILRQVDHMFQQIHAPDSKTTISELGQVHTDDLSQLATWNDLGDAPLPGRCVHHAIHERCLSHPDVLAVCAWDGDFSYKMLDEVSSALAYHLRDCGVGPETAVPLYSERSRWVTVGMLAIIKSGGAFVFLDPVYPLERLQQVCQDVNAKVILASREYTPAASALVKTGAVVTIGDEGSYLRNNGARRSLKTSFGIPSNALYVVFTSGSTGKPKGVVVEHRSFYLNAMGYSEKIGLNCYSRVFQFSKPAFDLIVMEHLSTLLVGGCICIPSEHERNSQIAQVITDMKVNWMFLTPSVARTLISPAEIPTVGTLVLGGEAMGAEDIATWSHSLRLMNGYGPAECAVITTVQPAISAQSNSRNIGRPSNSAVWITHPDNPNQLLPLGAVGEIVIEGPLVARGYLNDADKTETSFIPTPPWVKYFRGELASGSRLYRTGDMGQYQPDGSILFLGRRDGQVKLRGQRIELAEIEYNVRQQFSGSPEVIADVIRRGSQDSRQILVAMVAWSPGNDDEFQETSSFLGAPDDDKFQLLAASARSQLGRALPHHMVPTIFMPLNRIPLTNTLKTDRRLLHRHLSNLSPEEFDAFGGMGSHRAPTSQAERTLQMLFSSVLGLDSSQIHADSHFFQVGGDSIIAMKLVGEARQGDVHFTVADVFTQPVLSELAKVLHMSAAPSASIAPFNLLPEENQRTRVLRAAIDSCGLQINEIDDVYPCTPLQEGLIALTSQSSSMYVGQLTYELEENIDIDQLQTAWQITMDSNSILRTRLIQSEGDGTYQVVVKPHRISWRQHHSVRDYLLKDTEQAMTLGQPLTRFALIQPQKNQQPLPSYMVLTLHHALYDGWSIQLLLRQVDAAYHGMSVQAHPFTPFIKYVAAKPMEEEVLDFWKSEFAGLEAPPFPAGRGPAISNHVSSSRGSVERPISFDVPANSTVTISNAIRLAWAVVVSAYTDSEDVVFGVTLTGRNAPVPHIEDMTGPTFATVPFRVRVLPENTIHTALNEVQQHATRIIPFEQTGLQHIRKIGQEAAAACDFQSHLGVQLSQETTNSSTIMRSRNPLNTGFESFASYPLVVICTQASQNDGIHVHANFDPDVIPAREVETIVAQLAHVLQQLCGVRDPTKRIADIELVSPNDYEQLSRWNCTIPAPQRSTVHDLVLQHARNRSTAVAVSSTSEQVTFGELDTLSRRLAQELVARGVKKGDFVPLCFEKSIWPVVAMLGVLRAGGTCLNVDPALPAGRVRDMLDSAGPSLALCSPSRKQYLEDCTTRPLQVLAIPLNPASAPKSSIPLPTIEPDDAAFLIFTSGSTGVPKGIILEHVNLSTSIYHHRGPLQVGQDSRSLHFAGYAWDASVYEIFTTLIQGGCLCIPSEDERINDLAGFIRRSNVNWATLTPSVMSLLRPHEVPNLRAVSLGGEPISYELANMWADQLYLINGFGPAEATICAAGQIPTSGWKIGTIGPMLGSVGWVTLPSDPHRLAPLGAVGELLIEGPVVARGYLNQPEKTRAGFIEPPTWLSQFRSRCSQSAGRLYRSGDLVQLTKEGWIRYVGRRDTKVKLRGQRVDLGEIEHHVRSQFSGAREVVADVITRGDGQSALLVAFILCNIPTEQTGEAEGVFRLPDQSFQQQSNAVRMQMQDSLPSYMVPAALLPLRELPSTATGKTDRKRLHEEASKLSSTKFAQYEHGVGSARRAPSMAMEIQLQQLWARVLGIPAKDIGVDDNFFRLGGNSIGAMLLVSTARKLGVEMSVSDVFKCPKLCDLALVVKPDTSPMRGLSKSYQRCSLLKVEDAEKFIQELVAPGRSFQATDVIDVLPTTEFQRGYIHRNQRHYFMVFVRGLIDPSRLKGAIEMIVAKYGILRTVFVPLKDTVAQVTLHHHETPLKIVETTEDAKVAAQAISKKDGLEPFSFGAPYFQATLVAGRNNHSALILRISHAQYDGVSFPHLYTDLTRAYQGHTLAPATQFSDYIKCRVEIQSPQTWDFWKEFLKGSSMTCLDPVSLGGQPQSTSEELIHQTTSIALPITPEDITIATVFKAAWALVLARTAGQEDLVFGQVVHGRGIPLEGVENVFGPCVNIIPVRVTMQQDWRAIDLLRHLQDQHTRTLAFETTDLEDIVRHSTSWDSGTQFGTVAQHQNISLDPKVDFDGMDSTTDVHTTSKLADNFYAVSTPRGQDLAVEIVASSKMLSADTAGRLVAELAQMVQNLASNSTKHIDDCLR